MKGSVARARTAAQANAAPGKTTAASGAENCPNSPAQVAAYQLDDERGHDRHDDAEADRIEQHGDENEEERVRRTGGRHE